MRPCWCFFGRKQRRALLTDKPLTRAERRKARKALEEEKALNPATAKPRPTLYPAIHSICPKCEGSGLERPRSLTNYYRERCYTCRQTGWLTNLTSLSTVLSKDIFELFVQESADANHPRYVPSYGKDVLYALTLQTMRDEVTEMHAMLQIISEELRPVREARPTVVALEAFLRKRYGGEET